jgi:uncharacterized membrane protein (DUF106 family)
MNKKIALSTVLIAIIALALATWFVHNQISDLQNQINELQEQNEELQEQNTELQDQNTDLQDQLSELQNQKTELQDRLSELQNQLSELQNKIDIARDVKITAFEWIGGFNPVGGLTLAHPVKVTVKNMGINDISGLTLTVKLVYVDTYTEVGQGYVKQIDIIHAGEILEFSGEIWATIGSFSKDSAVCVITLTLGNVVLDEWTRNLETVY